MTKSFALFRSPEGKSYLATFALVSCLFLLWAFCNGMIDILNKHFQESLKINHFESGFVQFANYIAYFLMAIPAGILAKKFGYKGGILIGLVLMALGAFLFVPATRINEYWAFLTALFILAAGMTCLETIANPYATVLGPKESGTLRINIAQSFNGIGWVLGPLIGGRFVFGSGDASAVPDSSALYKPYMGVGIVVVVLAVLFVFAYVPDLQTEEEVPSEDIGKTKIPITHHKNFIFGVVAQFAYVAAQTGIFSFFINYVVENVHGMDDNSAKNWLTCGFAVFAIGRMFGSGVISVMKPAKALTAFACLSLILMIVTITGHGLIGLIGLFGSFFFMSIMYPTIFALGIHGLGGHTKLGSSIIVMSIVGGAIAPPIMGKIADHFNMQIGFTVPLVCFAVIALYGLFWERLSGHGGEAVAIKAGGH